MWQIHAQMAIDLARERAREAQQQALANQARALREAEERAHGLARPGRLRGGAAGALRALSAMLGTVSDAACDAAARLDRRAAEGHRLTRHA